MKVRYNSMFPGRILNARLAECEMYRALGMVRQVLEIDAGAPVQLEPPCAVEVVEATPEEFAALRDAGYELHGSPSAPGVVTADAHYDRGCEALAAGACDEAIEAFGQALALNPADTQAYFNRGYAFAVKLQSLATITVEADGKRRTWRGPGAEALIDAAVADFTQALAHDPRMSKAYGMRAEMYWLRGQNDLAAADYRQAACLGDESAAHLLRERFGRKG